MASTKPAAKLASKPTHKPAQHHQKPLEFYTTSSTGHQISNGVSKSAAWHKSRQSKLKSQFGDGSLPLSTILSAAKRSSGSSNSSSGDRNPTPTAPTATAAKPSSGSNSSSSDGNPAPSATPSATSTATATKGKPIFSSCNIHISGSTAPHISDHRLKHLLTFHGATVHPMLRRSTTTHVVLCPAATVGSGAGGGLAAKKLQKEIEAKKGAKMKFVTVQWALDSIAAGRRLPEGKFMEHGVGRDAGQSSLGAFLKKGNAK